MRAQRPSQVGCSVVSTSDTEAESHPLTGVSAQPTHGSMLQGQHSTADGRRSDTGAPTRTAPPPTLPAPRTTRIVSSGGHFPEFRLPHGRLLEDQCPD